MRMTIGKKLGVGFGLMILLMAVVAVVVFANVRKVNSIQTRVMEVRTPTAIAGIELHDGINYSLAALRGYMILGTDNWKNERELAWKSLDENMAKMREYSANWTNPRNVERFEEFVAVMEEFRIAQQQVEDIANTPQEQPALVILFEQAAPAASVMMKAITTMIDEEKTLEATPQRKALLATMADSRGSLGGGLASIRAYLIGGDTKFADEFRSKWKINTARFDTLGEKASMFNSAQLEAFSEYSKARAIFEPYPEEMFAIRSSSDWNVANKLLGTEAAPRAARAMSILGELIEDQQNLMTADSELLAAAGRSLVRTVIVVSVLAGLVGCALGFVLTRMITTPLKATVEMIREIAEGDGDLTRRMSMNRNDEIGEMGRWFDVFVKKVHDVVVTVNGASAEVATTATAIAATSERSAKGMVEQELQLAQIASAMEEMAASVVEVANKSSNAASRAADAQAAAEQGGDAVEKTVDSMTSIREAVAASAASVTFLGTQGEQIGEIIEVINDIAEQTNLLALNAAIEAARAGEHGRGFAVVADEVRKLADRTTKATEEISETIGAIQAETAKAVDLMNTGGERVQSGVERASDAGTNLSQIVSSTQDVAQMVQGIAAAAEEQSVAGEQVSRSIDAISNVVEQSSAGVAETAAAVAQLSAKSDQLQSLIKRFKLSAPDRRSRSGAAPSGVGERRSSRNRGTAADRRN